MARFWMEVVVDIDTVDSGRLGSSRISVARIEEAANLIDPVFLYSPQFVSESLSEVLGLQLLCKVESLNPIRSFKGRGTWYFVERFLADWQGGIGIGDGGPHLVCASAGNFGQGLAYAGRAHGIEITVFAAENANPLKIEMMQRFGARVELEGQDFDEAKVAAQEFATRSGAFYVEDGRLPAIAEGAGTIGLELTRWREPIDRVVVPLGNGALLAGIAHWFKTHSSETQIIGVCAEGAPAMAESWRGDRIIETETVETIADGIAVRVPIPEALEDLEGVVDDIILVSDELILDAMRLLHRELGVVIEPAGAAGLAGVMAGRAEFAGELVAVPLCGGNLTAKQLEEWLG